MSQVKGWVTAEASSRFDVLVEVGLLALVLETASLIVFRRAGLRSLGLEALAFDRAVPLLLAFVLLVLRVWRNERDVLPRRASLRPGHWLAGVGVPGLVLGAALLFVLWLVPPTGYTLGADGHWFFEQVRLAWLEGRVDDRVHAEPGPAILWSPFFLIVHGVILLARLFGSALPADGSGPPYVNAIRLGTVFWAMLAAVLAHRVCRRYFDPRLAAVAVVGVWLGSSLLHYTVAEPAMAHVPAAFTVSLFLLLWLRLRDDPGSGRRWIALAAAGGLLLSMQRYDLYFFLLPVLSALGLLRGRAGRASGRATRRLLVNGAGVIAAFALAALPLFLLNLHTSGSLLREGDLFGETLRYWDRPHVAELLYSSNGGLFAWTPVAYLGVLGLFLLARRERALAGALLATLSLGVYLLGSNFAWEGGWSFGNRRLAEAFPVFALGLCAVGEALLRRPGILPALGLLGLVGWNLSLSSQVQSGRVPLGGTVSFVEAAKGTVEQLYEKVGHLPSFPAPWLFAARYGVSPERFDLSYGHPRHERLAVRLGTTEDRAILGRGWSILSWPAGETPFRWSEGTESTLLVPLEAPVDYLLRFEGSAVRHPAGVPQTVELRVNGQAAGRVALGPDPTSVELLLPAYLWRDGLNEIALRYGWTLGREEAQGGPDATWSAVRLARVAIERAEH